MSGMHNLHRITGAYYTHFKPNLCPMCSHYDTQGAIGWYGTCKAKGTVLCCERSVKARCRDYQEKGGGNPHLETVEGAETR